MQPQALLNRLQTNQPNPALAAVYGSGPEELAAQTDRAVRLAESFQAIFPDTNDVYLFSSPGRTEVGGNHTDHNAGRVLAAAVNLDVMAVAGASGRNVIQIESHGYRRIIVDLDHLDPLEQEKGSPAGVVRGICARMSQLGYRIGGFNACMTSSVPNGSGLSSSASFELMVATVLNELFNQGQIQPVQAAQISQYAEIHYFGKPCGLMDQTTCAVGGFVTIDFKDFDHPIVHKVDFDFTATGYTLAIIGTGGNHADLTDEYASIASEMKSVAAALGGQYLRQVSLEAVMQAVPELRGKVSDRAILRAVHFFNDDARVVDEVAALERGDFPGFLSLVVDSGRSSWELLQNIYSIKNAHEQGVAIALTIAASLLKGRGAWRVHGGGFAGTIQAFVPADLIDEFMTHMSAVFGPENCHMVSIRSQGATRINL